VMILLLTRAVPLVWRVALQDEALVVWKTEARRNGLYNAQVEARLKQKKPSASKNWHCLAPAT
jgi:uncharacterized Zn finger protein